MRLEDWQFQFADAIMKGPYGVLKLLIQYGSYRSASDRDYFAVYDEDPPTQNMMLGKIDMWAIGQERFFRYIEKLDPFVTEPILTGQVLFDQDQSIAKAKERLDSVTPSNDTFTYLLSRSFEAFLQARLHLINIQEESPFSRRDYWSTLSFSIAYWAFANRYKNGNEYPLALGYVIQRSPTLLKKLWKKVTENKAKNNSIESNTISDWSAFLLQS